jgi:hypothetical protein
MGRGRFSGCGSNSPDDPQPIESVASTIVYVGIGVERVNEEINLETIINGCTISSHTSAGGD